MKNKYLQKLFFKQWVIGIVKDDIEKIIQEKNFTQNITWIKPGSPDHFQADPFIIEDGIDTLGVIFEEFSLEDNYGNLSFMTLDSSLKILQKKILLDTGSHISFPFVYKEDGRVYTVPESARSGKVSCYEFIGPEQQLKYLGDLVKMPLYDPSVLKMNGKYWLLGTVFENRSIYHLHVFHADSLTGPYTPLQKNPVKSGLDGIRSAGGFIEVDGSVYRPAQNCSRRYGESITINKILNMNEFEFSEEAYMKIEIDERNRKEHNIHTIHTLNVSGNTIIVDGMRWELSFIKQIENYFRNRKLEKAGIEKLS